MTSLSTSETSIKPLISRLRFSDKVRNQIIQIKKVTQLPSYAAVCRLGFCYSLATEHLPTPVPLVFDSNLEIDWDTFAGEIGVTLLAALKVYCQKRNVPLDEENQKKHFYWHLFRGIGYLYGRKMKQPEDIFDLLIDVERQSQENEAKNKGEETIITLQTRSRSFPQLVWKLEPKSESLFQSQSQSKFKSKFRGLRKSPKY